MRAILREGRRIWSLFEIDGIRVAAGPWMIIGFKQLLPAGPLSDGEGERKRSLVQIYTDPGGMRTLAVADIWGRDPDLTDRPW